MHQCRSRSKITRPLVKKPGRDTVSIYDLTAWYLVNYLLSTECSLNFPPMNLLKANITTSTSVISGRLFFTQTEQLLLQKTTIVTKNEAEKPWCASAVLSTSMGLPKVTTSVSSYITLLLRLAAVLLIASIIQLSKSSQKGELWDRFWLYKCTMPILSPTVYSYFQCLQNLKAIIKTTLKGLLGWATESQGYKET